MNTMAVFPHPLTDHLPWPFIEGVAIRPPVEVCRWFLQLFESGAITKQIYKCDKIYIERERCKDN